MDEDVEAEKIRVLEERMALFEKGAGGSSASAPRANMSSAVNGEESDHSSDSSSDDSSGSDSE